MATFNFSTMQMTVKVVYYGPGLCGKTTNLQFIYSHTTPKSRGEMVSLETKSDRTLFFDLLPLEVGTIAGFKTKVQLYTVPGQVFYNTTRKLVLKGVDGIVFVADSQRPMLPSNIESLANLETNLSELGIVMDTVPLVFQYNKRDLKDICSADELDASMNDRGAPAIEAAALTGMGVFETLRAISRLTLGALKKQLEEGPPLPAKPAAATPRPTPTRLEVPLAAKSKERQPDRPPTRPAPAKRPTPAATPRPTALPPTAPSPTPSAPTPMTAGQSSAAASAVAAAAAARPRPVTPPKPLARPASVVTPSDGDGKIRRDLLLRLKKSDFERVRRVSLNLRVEDGQQHLVHEVRDLQLDLQSSPNPGEMLLQLNIRMNPDDQP